MDVGSVWREDRKSRKERVRKNEGESEDAVDMQAQSHFAASLLKANLLTRHLYALLNQFLNICDRVGNTQLVFSISQLV